MKKILVLPLFALAVLASQAWAQDWVICTGQYAGYCKWSLTGTGCDQISSGPPPDGKATCELAYKNCKDNGYIYSNSGCTTWSGEGNNPNFNNGVALWCKWATSCHPIKSETELISCDKDGSVFSGVPSSGVGDGKTCAGGTWTGQGKNPNAIQLGCCKWSTETNCYPIMEGPDPTDGLDGTTKVASCQTGSNKFWNGTISCPETCPTSTPTYPKSSSSVASSSSRASSSSAGSSSSSSRGSSSSVSGSSSSSSSSSSSISGNSSSSEGTDPIISHNNAPVVGLTVLHFASSLQIASDKNATVALFDIHGKQILSQKVLSGTTTINLQKQRQGVYYAVVKSDSNKQTVKIVLK